MEVDGTVQCNMFQSTRPRRGAIGFEAKTLDDAKVSIHAPPEGRDNIFLSLVHLYRCFNPRSPGGARYISTTLTH